MKPLPLNAFNHWLDMYGLASNENNAKASSELFALDARYYESPFDEPMIGHQAIYQYWSKGAQRFKDNGSSYEIFSVSKNLGIARWRSQFTIIDTGKRVALDCLFVVEFNEDGLCSVFREWWHSQVSDPMQNEQTS